MTTNIYDDGPECGSGVVKPLACGARGPGPIPGLATSIAEVGYFCVQVALLKYCVAT